MRAVGRVHYSPIAVETHLTCVQLFLRLDQLLLQFCVQKTLSVGAVKLMAMLKSCQNGSLLRRGPCSVALI